MYVPSDLKSAFEGEDLNAAKNAMHSLCKSLNYGLIASCSCKDKARYRLKNDRWKCSAATECFHYGKPATEAEGIIFSFESYNGSLHKDCQRELANKRHRERKEFGIPYLTVADNFAKETYFKTNLRSVSCHVHGDRWNEVEGKEVDTDFECRKFPIFVETFGSNLHAPPVVKSIGTDRLLQFLQSR